MPINLAMTEVEEEDGEGEDGEVGVVEEEMGEGAIGMTSRDKATGRIKREEVRSNGARIRTPSTENKGQDLTDGGMPCHCSLHTHHLHSSSLPPNPYPSRLQSPITNSDHSSTKQHYPSPTDCSLSSP